MLLSIYLCLLFFSLIHATPLHRARGDHGSLQPKSWQYNSPITPGYVKRENPDDTSSDDTSSPDLTPTATTSTSPSSTPTDLNLNDDSANNADSANNDDNPNSDKSPSNEDQNSKEDENSNSEDKSSNDKSSSDESLGDAEINGAATKKKQGATTKNAAITKDATSSEDAASWKEDPSPKEDPSTKEDPSSKEDPSPKGASSKGLSKGSQSIIRASFTSNPKCGQTISCNAGKTNDHTGVNGTGAAAVNGMLFGGPPGVYDGSGGYTNINGVGGACGSCWTLTPGYNYYESNGKSLGKTVVVRINDACTDPGYCDQKPGHPLNTGPTDGVQKSGKFNAPVHFDLCEATGVAAAFFGEIKTGVAIGAAQYNPDCTGLEDGEFGAKTVSELAMPS
ncbi:MAG: hypothetical protein L6R38_000694 [Xanthoria sp. 2 TBL-2021]|nr:MAG: hypothetical protein L6R38_000694 [Xanthoria sp. 2 TBL-2021]